MTAFDRFDPFEQRFNEALEDVAEAQRPDYLDDVFSVTARTTQRPRWSFPERWLPMDLAARRPAVMNRVPLRQLALLLILLLAAIGTAILVGSQPKLPAPFGPAENGQIVFVMNGDVYALDSLASEPRLLLAAPGDQLGVINSPNGLLFAFDSLDRGVDRVYVANADGSNPRQVLDEPFTGLAATWSPDSRTLALVTEAGPGHQLWLAPADGSGARPIDLGSLRPWDVIWDPQRPAIMLMRAQSRPNGPMDLYYVDTSGTILSVVDMTTGLNLNGPMWEYSGLAFSPDGKTIAYNSIEAIEPPNNRYRVHVMNRDGTNDRAIPAPLESRYSQAWPKFSPDGAWIVMESWTTADDDTAINQVAIAPSDGSAVARWIGPREPGQPLGKAWSPDGTYLLVSLDGQSQVYVVDPVSGSADKLPWPIDLPDVQRVSAN